MHPVPSKGSGLGRRRIPVQISSKQYMHRGYVQYNSVQNGTSPRGRAPRFDRCRTDTTETPSERRRLPGYCCRRSERRHPLGGRLGRRLVAAGRADGPWRPAEPVSRRGRPGQGRSGSGGRPERRNVITIPRGSGVAGERPMHPAVPDRSCGGPRPPTRSRPAADEHPHRRDESLRARSGPRQPGRSTPRRSRQALGPGVDRGESVAGPGGADASVADRLVLVWIGGDRPVTPVGR